MTKRITLVEGPPFAGEMATLVEKFHSTSFPTVFRDTKIPTRRVSFSTTPPKSISPKPPSWAATVQSKPAQANNLPARQTTQTPPSVSVPIPRNSKSQRVDPPIKASQTMVAIMKQKKLCNNWYLTAYCPYNDCKHGHNEKLNEKQIAALRLVARCAPCSQGLDCDDEDCFSGHRCPRDHCIRGIECRFPADMHDVDNRVFTQ